MAYSKQIKEEETQLEKSLNKLEFILGIVIIASFVCLYLLLNSL